MMPKAKVAEGKPMKPAKYQSKKTGKYEKPKKKKKGLFARVLDEAWDTIEDVFD